MTIYVRFLSIFFMCLSVSAQAQKENLFSAGVRFSLGNQAIADFNSQTNLTNATSLKQGARSAGIVGEYRLDSNFSLYAAAGLQSQSFILTSDQENFFFESNQISFPIAIRVYLKVTGNSHLFVDFGGYYDKEVGNTLKANKFFKSNNEMINNFGFLGSLGFKLTDTQSKLAPFVHLTARGDIFEAQNVISRAGYYIYTGVVYTF